jgi:outer membrane protein assembly factor BamB
LVSSPGTYDIGVRATNANGTTVTDRTAVNVTRIDRSNPLLWNATLTNPVSVAVGPDRTYVLVDALASETEADDNVVYALDRDDGAVAWRTRPPVVGSFGLDYANGTLTVGGEGAAELDPATGEVRWTVTADEFVSSTVLTSETAYVRDRRDVTAVDRSTGEVRWSRRTDGDGYEPPRAGSGVVAYWSQGYNNTPGAVESPLVVRDETTGEELWRLDRDGGSPVIAGVVDGRVIAAYDGTLVAHDARNGSVLWSREMPNRSVEYGYVQELAVDDGTVYASVSDYPGQYVVAVEADGDRLWTRRTADVRGFVADGGSVYAAGGDTVRALNGTTGAVRWETPVYGGLAYDLRVPGERIVVQQRERTAVLDRTTGDRVWSETFEDTLEETIRVDDGTVFVHTEAGVYAVALDDDG